MSTLFDPAVIGSLRVKNRFARSATAECMADADGLATPRLVELYSRLAEGGIGLIVTGGAYVHPSGRSYVGVTGVHDDASLPGLTQVAGAVHDRGSRIALQLYHCGRQGEPQATGGRLVAPSPIPDRLVRVRPHGLSVEEIQEIVAAFGDAAARARASGFDAVQILAGNGYLINQFLSPHSNRRDDEWGGNPRNRRRFLLSVYAAVRKSVGPEFPVLVKLTAGDFVHGGLGFQDALVAAQELAALGVDALEITGGTLESIFRMSRGDIPVEQILHSRLAAGLSPVERQLVWAAATAMRGRVKPEEGYFAAYARQIRKTTRVPVILVGGLRTVRVMEKLVEQGAADMVALARPFLREPDLLRRLQAEENGASRCRSCNRCLVSVADGDGVRCFDLHSGQS
jgi:2,4-dienoyl-CoA reductase-like NADH-dependent reductase (Old Yellow Enzyme family)